MPWPLFPQCPAFGFTSLPDYSVTIVERSSGIRQVNRNWYYPLHTYTAVPIGEKLEDDIHRILRFWHAIGGQSGRFLFKDYVDFKSSVDISAAITPLDMPLVFDDDSPGGYQLTKIYQDPDFLFTQQRKIQKPRPGTIRVANDSGVEQAANRWTIDYDTGLLTTLGGFVGTPTTWGGEFYVPAMFETRPQFVITNKRIQSTEFSVREIRIDDEEL